jgi:two-component system sensor histidine kinase MprB
VRPVIELRDTAESIADTQDLTTPIPSGGPGEIGSLAHSFTTMVQALATSRQQQQRLITDASHEMRTPLTSLRTNLELLEFFEQLPAGDRAAILDAVQDDVGELTNLLTELVELATDQLSTDEMPEPVDLADLARDVAARAARRSGREIAVVDGGPAPVTVRPQMLSRAISNLVDNAVKYSPAGSPVEVAVGVLRRGPAARVRPLLPVRGGAHRTGFGTRVGDRRADRAAPPRLGVGTQPARRWCGRRLRGPDRQRRGLACFLHRSRRALTRSPDHRVAWMSNCNPTTAERHGAS